MTSSKSTQENRWELDGARRVSSEPAFPDISGEWMMDIYWQHRQREGKVTATATIRQDLTGMNMEVHSTGSDSHTLLAHPGHETSGSPVLYYIYEVEPKAIGSDAEGPYKGAAILRFYADRDELSGNYWTSQLSKGHFKLSRKTRRWKGGTVAETVDVVLITAIPEEFDAAKEVFSAAAADGDGVLEWDDSRIIQSAPHIAGIFRSSGSPLFRMVLATPTRMGANRTGHLATVLVDRLQPKCLVMCGVCAGNPGDLALGDIVVSELAYQYDEGKFEVSGFVGDHRQSPISPAWLRAAKALKAENLPSYGPPSQRDARYWVLERLYGNGDPRNHPARKRYFARGKWQAMIEELEREGLVKVEGKSLHLTDVGTAEVERSILMDVDPPLKLPITIKTGPIASGNVVVKDGLTWDKLKQMGVRSVLGLEMEAAAIGEIARGSGVQEWIVIKAVMDHADPKKDDRFKPFAARASAEALRAFIVARFGEATQDLDSYVRPDRPLVASQPGGWQPRTLMGRFFDDLGAALEKHAPRFKGVFNLAVAKAIEAYGFADDAYGVSEKVRVALGDAIGKAHRGKLGKVPKTLKAEPMKGATPFIAKIWNSHDEYIGEAAGDDANGLGVTRAYVFSEAVTPNLQSSYAGQHEAGKYGPVGVYTFPDQSQFAGQWTGGNPNFGYREYLGDRSTLKCDFYLGSMIAEPNHLQPRWRPHGEGIAVDASLRRVRCGTLREGAFDTISVEFDF